MQALAHLSSGGSAALLFECLTGSRAWGFASPDSDYDVRFTYVHPRDWYVAVVEPRDVIAEMLPGDLDLSGWELRKTLRLFAKCNLALNEWLDSPVVYSERPGEIAKELPAGTGDACATCYGYRTLTAASHGRYANHAESEGRSLPCRWHAEAL